jgi:hypothetical protein
LSQPSQLVAIVERWQGSTHKERRIPMATKFDSRKSQDQREIIFYSPDRWMNFIIQYVVAGITKVVTSIITVTVIFFVLLGGLWLVYSYLPGNVFKIVLAVLIADILLGIIVRYIQSRR